MLNLDKLLDATDDSHDLLRIPANNKFRFNLETHHAHSEHQEFCNSFLFAIGVNRDLVPRIAEHARTCNDDYIPPKNLAHCITQSLEKLAADLFQCTLSSKEIYTVEDKDPSVLWQANNDKIFNLWFHLLSNQPQRWKICDYTNDDVLLQYCIT